MATPSNTIPLGTRLPAGRVTDSTRGTTIEVAALAAGKRGALVMFISNHCPYVVHIRRELGRVANQAIDDGFGVLAINSNSLASHPQDGPEHMAALARAEGWRFPFAFDDSQDVARAFGAACTPDLYLFDAAGQLAYHGQFDSTRPGKGTPDGKDLRAALAAVAAGQAPADEQRASVGCSIKWK
jgi:hypothetical protein